MSYFLSKNHKPVVAIVLSFVLLASNGGCSKTQDVQTNIASSLVSSKDQAQLQKPENLFDSVVDQANTNLTLKWSYNIYLSPMGQEFMPKLHALDAIELMLDDASCSQIGSQGGSLKLQIRESTITGRILAVSETVHFPNCFNGIMRFNFPEVVVVNPGQMYVMEAAHVSDNTSTLYMNETPDNYSGGDFIMNGIVRPGKDLWFREGLFNFIARRKEQVKEVGWQNLVRHDGSKFKSHGDCLQYVNNAR
jgi:hypothetical protein